MEYWNEIKRDMQRGTYSPHTLGEHFTWYQIMLILPQLRQEFGFRRGEGLASQSSMLRWGQCTISLMPRRIDLTPFTDRRTQDAHIREWISRAVSEAEHQVHAGKEVHKSAASRGPRMESSRAHTSFASAEFGPLHSNASPYRYGTHGNEQFIPGEAGLNDDFVERMERASIGQAPVPVRQLMSPLAAGHPIDSEALSQAYPNNTRHENTSSASGPHRCLPDGVSREQLREVVDKAWNELTGPERRSLKEDIGITNVELYVREFKINEFLTHKDR